MYTNKLVEEKSPYLLQHAHNPVDWYPWSQEAFDKAKTENKPIFLSIGYSTCHWCHVMERESFENEAVAKLLNDSFVSIKVDREERPDVDRVYMTFVQSATGGGGWPMSVWLTPDLKPFYGGTYYPPADAYGRPGFPTVLNRLAEAWASDRERVIEASAKVIEQLSEQVARAGKSGVQLDAGDVENGFYNFRRAFDSKNGGFGAAPKFPRPVTYDFLLAWHAKSGNEEALEMVLKTLREMAAGGMNDHLGGGFHRYSVDERWFVPHFEKMLYDQAQLAVSYLRAFQITGGEQYARIARDIFEYVIRDMTHEGGAFYSAEDADSVIDPADPHEKGEGAFYVWTSEEIQAVAGGEAAEWFNHRYGVVEGGNVENDPQEEFTGKCILYEARGLDHVAEHFDKPAEEIAAAIEALKPKLLEARAKRVRPHLDDKILTAWNGLMISAFAIGYQALGDERYLEAARRAADFILSEMHDPDTRALLRRYRDGEGAIDGFLDDYAFLAQGLIDLYEASFDRRYLDTAESLAAKMIELFRGGGDGAFYSAGDGGGDLVLRLKDDYDGAEPSGNAVAMLVLLRLSQATGRQDFRQAAESALNDLSKTVRSGPATAPLMLVALDFLLSTPKQIVIGGEPADEGFADLARAARSRYIPHRVLLHAGAGARSKWESALPALAGMDAVDGKAAAYVCENYTCQLPVTSVAALDELLQ